MLAPLVRVCSPHRISVLSPEALDPHGCLRSLVHPQSIPPWASSFQPASQHLFVEHSPHPKQAFSSSRMAFTPSDGHVF